MAALRKPQHFIVVLNNDSYFCTFNRAADWNLAEPAWTGRMRLVSKGNECSIKLEDKTTGELYAKCPIDTYPGIAIEAVNDSSRYFVLRIQDDNGNELLFVIKYFNEHYSWFCRQISFYRNWFW